LLLLAQGEVGTSGALAGWRLEFYERRPKLLEANAPVEAGAHFRGSEPSRVRAHLEPCAGGHTRERVTETTAPSTRGSERIATLRYALGPLTSSTPRSSTICPPDQRTISRHSSRSLRAERRAVST
jgi:hypothetical protein